MLAASSACVVVCSPNTCLAAGAKVPPVFAGTHFSAVFSRVAALHFGSFYSVIFSMLGMCLCCYIILLRLSPAFENQTQVLSLGLGT